MSKTAYIGVRDRFKVGSQVLGKGNVRGVVTAVNAWVPGFADYTVDVLWDNDTHVANILAGNLRPGIQVGDWVGEGTGGVVLDVKHNERRTIVLAYTGSKPNPFVTWINVQAYDVGNGNYFAHLSKAYEDFLKRN